MLSCHRSAATRHLLYLQLRRDILEEGLKCDNDQASQLAGLALQAEYGNYDKQVLGMSYFNPEYYFCPHIVRRVGVAYIRDNIPEVHSVFRGLAQTQAKMEFIKVNENG